MSAQGELVAGSLIVFAPDAARAREVARADAYALGWAQVRIELEQMSGGPYPPVRGLVQYHWLARIKAVRRVSGDRLNAWEQAGRLSGRIKPGARVRTLVGGENWSGGTRHIMPSGSIGVVRRRVGRGPYLRVCFPQVPARTFVYSPDGLEIADPLGRSNDSGLIDPRGA